MQEGTTGAVARGGRRIRVRSGLLFVDFSSDAYPINPGKVLAGELGHDQQGDVLQLQMPSRRSNRA